MNKKYIQFYILFGLLYAGQSMGGLASTPLFFWLKDTLECTPQQVIYYTSIATVFWTIKPVFSIFIDTFALFGSHRKSYIKLSYILILFACIYIAVFGLNLLTFILFSCLISLSYAIADISCDGFVCELGKQYNLLDRLQTAQWVGAGLLSCVTGVGGAYIAQYYSYRLAYVFIGLSMIFLLFYICRIDKTKDRQATTIINTRCWSGLKETLQCKQIWLGCCFLFCFYFSPSFSTMLQYKLIDTMGMTKMQLGYMTTIAAICSVIGTLLFGFICKKLPLKKFLYCTVVISSASTLAYLYIPGLTIVFIYTAVFSLVGGVTHIVILSYCGSLVKENCEAIVFSGLMSILNLGGLLSGYCGAFLFEYTGLNVLIIISGAFTLICLLFIPFLKLQGGK